MDAYIQAKCVRFIRNREGIKSVFPLNYASIHLAAALMYSMHDRDVHPESLQRADDLLRSKVGWFSSFRGMTKVLVTSTLALHPHPEYALERMLFAYDHINGQFWSSVYQPIAASILSSYAEPKAFPRLVERMRQIYDAVRSRHPFLTTQEDASYCAILALGEEPIEKLDEEIEACYSILSEAFFLKHGVQGLALVLANYPGDPSVKCERAMTLYHAFEDQNHRFGAHYELPTLGLMAMAEGDPLALVRVSCEIDDWLSYQKGFGLFSGISRTQRLMFAALLASKEYMDMEVAPVSAMNQTVSMMLAQQSAMIASIITTSSVIATTSRQHA